ncbi:LEAF RUST 10 DISEASE-RESISTANCE LOCUS RECEPTOR-LIKE PROTEIN KINASE-like 1.2 isoform X1 [Tasmannia lanceolata]|uniref:LEAF RUST 10 DISEASE-RESISTANCE LOCUS RECEPTOR-LIKE PROTEIN KINASE-like 1.2 isoform X1 n=1 Tax=Tasmannia lanceolata TaxID=3420 RepID=UPI0040646199
MRNLGESLQMHQVLLLSSLIFLFFTPISFSQHQDEISVDCSPSPFPCGTITLNISCPFHVDNRSLNCSYPGFEITCKNNIAPEIKIGSMIYQVKKIDYKNRILTIADNDFTGKKCPDPRPENTALNMSLFEYPDGHYQSISLYNCSTPIHNSAFHEIECLPKPGNYFYFTLAPFEMSIFFKHCGVTLLKKISNKSANRLLGLRDLSIDDLVKEDFDIMWRVGLCSPCLTVGGFWAPNARALAQEPTCFCSNQSQLFFSCPTTPPAPSSVTLRLKKASNKTIIGVISGIGALLVCIIAFVLFRCCWKRLHFNSSALLSRSKSLDPPSKQDLEKCDSNSFHTCVFTYEELEEATNNFDHSKELGHGGFGTVYYGKLRDGRSVAVKRLYKNNYKRVEQFLNEVEILSSLRHHNLVSLYGCTSRHSRELLLVYEFVPNGTVADHLHGDCAPTEPLTWPTRMSIAIETAGALAYLHAIEPPIIHRDVKTNNILLDNNSHVKVADFGLSRLLPVDVTHVSTAPQGTPGYVDPDYHKCYQLTDKSDVYSFGVVLVELISSKPAVDISRHQDEINLAYMALNKILNNALHELVDLGLGFEFDYGVRRMITLVAELAFRCLQEDREVRPSMEEVLEVLRGIESDEYPTKKVEEIDVTSDDVGLIMKTPSSPDTVMDPWVSRSTTPNTSG